MHSTIFGRWTLDVDVEATRAAYDQLHMGAPERCGCDPCLNFAAQREHTFPPAVRAFLRDANVSIDREAEVYHNCRLESGLHSYGGWFHLVGRIVSGVEANVSRETDCGTFGLHDFDSGVRAGISTRVALLHPAFDAQSVLQLEFSAEIPWEINAAEAN